MIRIEYADSIKYRTEQNRSDSPTRYASREEAAMHSDGYKFFRSVNGVWLTKRVPKKYLSASRGEV